MLLQDLREIKSSKKELRDFAIVIAVALMLIGGYLAWRGHFYAAFPIAAALLLAPVLFDALFKTNTAAVLIPLQKTWMAIAILLGHVISRIILGLFFFGVFTAIRALNTIIGKPLLDTAWKGDRETYWIKRDAAPNPPERAERQY
ncbi:MAG: hypothetical protein KF886_20800 [Candidatus Hydrogenedentes bacterium]|nr:hypothetical protein [Candidatus Hydrogenedentota bacterium]